MFALDTGRSCKQLLNFHPIAVAVVLLPECYKLQSNWKRNKFQLNLRLLTELPKTMKYRKVNKFLAFSGYITNQYRLDKIPMENYEQWGNSKNVP